MTINLRLFVILILVVGCNSVEINPEPKIQDLTLYRGSLTKHQKEYNEEALYNYKKLLATLRLQPLTDLPIDSNGLRIILSSGWVWSGSPISLAIFSNGKKCSIETSEIVRWKDHFLNRIDNPYLSKNLYYSDTTRFNRLAAEISKSDFWDRYSFNENNAGWRNTSESQYFIEAKIDSFYKLITEEQSDSVIFHYFYHFLKATDYSDTITNLLEMDFEHRYIKQKKPPYY